MTNNAKRLVRAAVVAALAAPVSAYATNGYQLIGIGSYQKSLAGAVTAKPGSAMTAISNPAGMARVGNRADFAMELFMPRRTVDFGSMGGDKESGGSEQYGVPAIGWTAPAFGDNMFFGGGMYGTSGLGVDYGEVDMMPGAALDMSFGAPMGTHEDVTFDGYSAIQFWKAAPTVSWDVDDKLSLGVALNLDYQSVTIRQTIRNVPFWNDPTNPMAGVTQRDVSLDLGRPTSSFGYGASFGALYDVNDMVTLGFSFTTEQSFPEQEYRVGTGDVQNFNGAVGKAGTYDMDLDYPGQAAVGIAVKPNAALTVSADVKWIGWSDTHDKVDLSGPANSFDTDGDGMGDADSTELNFGWEDQTVLALGVEYMVNNRLTLRAGYNYSEAPIDEKDVFNNLIFPAIVEKHYTLGGKYRFGDNWEMDFHYMRAVQEDMTGENDVPAGFQQMTPFQASSGSEISLEEDSVGIQLGYRF